MSKQIIGLVAGLLFLGACQPNPNQKTPVAQVGDSYLYLEDLSKIIPNDLKGPDSTLWVDDFVRKWVQNELIILNAEQNLSDDQKDVDQELEDYRNSLITYRYKKELMAQKMDTIVSDNDISSYYTSHMNRYKLRENIVKVIFMKIPMEVANAEVVKSLSRDNDPEKISQLNEYGMQYAKVFDRFGDKWTSTQNILNLLPEKINIDEQFLRRNKFIESSDTDYYYFICIRDFRLKGENAPIEYITPEIRNILLNERKIQFLKNIEEDIYNEGLASNKFKIYNIKK